MPKLLIFAPCQKAIIDKADNTVSLIGVIQGLVINLNAVRPIGDIPVDAVIPMSWAIATVWLQTPEDGEKKFEQRIDIITPNNTRLPANAQQFQMLLRTHQIAVIAASFPIGIQGEYKLVLSLREVEANGEWIDLAEYPIEIQHSADQQQAG